MRTLLFFDDWNLENRFHVVRRQGSPQWDAQATLEDPSIEGLGNFPTVFRTDDGTWRAMYWAYTGGVRLLTAESADGRTWRKPEVWSASWASWLRDGKIQQHHGKHEGAEPRRLIC